MAMNPSKPSKLTARQQEILDLIREGVTRTGAPPTRAEIARQLGFKSANAAEEHLQAPVSYTHLTLPTTPYV